MRDNSAHRIERFLRGEGLQPAEISIEGDVARVQFQGPGEMIAVQAEYTADSTDESVASDLIDAAARRGLYPPSR
jgi:hypothetical protein